MLTCLLAPDHLMKPIEEALNTLFDESKTSFLQKLQDAENAFENMVSYEGVEFEMLKSW